MRRAAGHLRHAGGYLAGGAGRSDETGAYPFAIERGEDGAYLLGPAPPLRALLHERRERAGAHPIGPLPQWRADLVRDICLLAREETGIATVALSGGVFQNATLLRAAGERLRRAGFAVLTHQLVPPNDGGLALGQAAIAAITVRHT